MREGENKVNIGCTLGTKRKLTVVWADPLVVSYTHRSTDGYFYFLFNAIKVTECTIKIGIESRNPNFTDTFSRKITFQPNFSINFEITRIKRFGAYSCRNISL